MAQTVVRGRGSLNGGSIAALIQALQMEKPLLVCGARMAEVFSRRTGMTLPTFSGYHPNPDLADSEAGAVLYRLEGCDGVISLGGGSAMDTAKAVKALLLTGDMARVKRSDLPADAVLPHIAIPGTAGTGAEATPFAVTYVDGQKLSLDHPQLLPEAVLLDSSLLDTLPEYHRKACAMDALSQGIESFWAKTATAESRSHAGKAIRGVVFNMSAYLAGDAQAQDAMLEAAYESGCAIRISRTTAAHAMSYQITKLLGPAHGHACLITLPVLWDRMCADPDQRELMKELASRMRLGDPLMGSRLMRGMLIDLGMEAPPAPSEEILRKLVDSVNPERLGNHPQTLGTAEIEVVYRQAFRPVLDPERQACLDIWRYYGA